jgi:hypothetical protein
MIHKTTQKITTYTLTLGEVLQKSLSHSMQRRRVIYDLLFVYTQQDLMDEAQHKTRKRVEEIITHQFMLLYKESE